MVLIRSSVEVITVWIRRQKKIGLIVVFDTVEGRAYQRSDL